MTMVWPTWSWLIILIPLFTVLVWVLITGTRSAHRERLRNRNGDSSNDRANRPS